MNINNNLKKLNQIKFLFNELIYVDLKYKNLIKIKITSISNQIKSYIDWMITNFYFTNIIEFELIKENIIKKLIYINDIFNLFNQNMYLIKKIYLIINLTKNVIYPAYLNSNNNEKYINEIKKSQKINFYHKLSTVDIDNDFYDEEIDFYECELKETNEFNCINSTNSDVVNNNEKNIKDFSVYKIKKKEFYDNIDFIKSSIII